MSIAAEKIFENIACNSPEGKVTYDKLFGGVTMEKYIIALQNYCKRNPPNHGDAQSVMNLLYWVYTEYNPIDDQKIKNCFARLRNHFPELDLKQFDPIFVTVSDLCAEHERLAFMEGLRLGVTLMLELSEK